MRPRPDVVELLGRLGVAQPFLDLGVPRSGGRGFYRGAQISSFTAGDGAGFAPPSFRLSQ